MLSLTTRVRLELCTRVQETICRVIDQAKSNYWMRAQAQPGTRPPSRSSTALVMSSSTRWASMSPDWIKVPSESPSTTHRSRSSMARSGVAEGLVLFSREESPTPILTLLTLKRTSSVNRSRWRRSSSSKRCPHPFQEEPVTKETLMICFQALASTRPSWHRWRSSETGTALSAHRIPTSTRWYSQERVDSPCKLFWMQKRLAD